MSRLLESLRGRLVVSCQAYPGEPMNSPTVMASVAQAVAIGGAAGIRAQGLDEIAAIRACVSLPLVGLWKVQGHEVFITPTAEHALAVAAAGADIVAVDGTTRPRPDGAALVDTITAVHSRTDALAMADCSCLADGVAAAAAGADVVATTLAGYTGDGPGTTGPDQDLVSAMADRLETPVIAEGRIHTPAQAAAAIERGAFAVVVGTAITHPTSIAKWFAGSVERASGESA
ncbi:MAG: N-acetylmannosamine-6-phosphate 2-epimerase [Streptosporangiales bacterium]